MVTAPPSVTEYVQHCRNWLRLALTGELGIFLKRVPPLGPDEVPWAKFNWDSPSVKQLEQLIKHASLSHFEQWAKEVAKSPLDKKDPTLRGLRSITSQHFAYPVLMAATRYDC
jgi:hypothetical protein